MSVNCCSSGLQELAQVAAQLYRQALSVDHLFERPLISRLAPSLREDIQL